jgi:hypothetical protein
MNMFLADAHAEPGSFSGAWFRAAQATGEC